jgi:hypothetical protein
METLKNLSEESMAEIQQAIEEKVQQKVEIHVQKALVEQDELYANKLKQLLEAIDKDHSIKLEKVVAAIDSDRAGKLKLVVSKYENALTADAEKFKKQLVESISDYLDTYLEEKIPVTEVQEAVRNKKAVKVLEGLRAHLAIDAALQKESIKEAILDGKVQIDEASKKLESVVTENAQLKHKLDKTNASLIIEQKTAALDETQKRYMKKVFADKTPEFINENFDYTLKLFNKKVDNRLESLKEEAISETTKVDRIILEQNEEEVVSESTQYLSPYLQELRKY